MNVRDYDDRGAFILLRDQPYLSEEEIVNGKPSVDEVYLGSLYKKVDDRGVISEISIETHSYEYFWNDIELYFEEFHPEELHIPLHARIDRDRAFTEVLNGSNMSDGEEANAFLDEDELREMSKSDRLQAETAYGNIVWSAQRLFERVVRKEPVLVGYKSNPHGYRNPMRDLEPIFILRGPFSRRRDFNKNITSQRLAQLADRSLVRITLKPEPSESKSAVISSNTDFPAPFSGKARPGRWPWFTLDLCLRADGFPARVDHFTGIATLNGDRRYGLLVNSDGDVEILGFRGKLSKMKTNIMARQFGRDNLLAFWPEWHAQPQGYRVTKIEQLSGINLD